MLCYYTIPGLFTPLENARTWDYRAQVWLREQGEVLTENTESTENGKKYSESSVSSVRTGRPRVAACGFNCSDGLIGATLALAGQGAMVGRDLWQLHDAGFECVVVAHSNGCRIALEAMESTPSVLELNLIAAAVDADCENNGLNDMARREQVYRVVLYVSAEDEILGLPGSYGDLGKNGPTNVAPELAKILTVVRRKYRHCDWVGNYFIGTMQLVAGLPPLLEREHTAVLTENTESTENGQNFSASSVSSVRNESADKQEAV